MKDLLRNMAKGDGSVFKKYVDMLPVPPNELVASALTWFLRRQDPDNIDLDLYENGYRITVKTDKENVKEMSEFWSDYVKPMLGDDDG